MMIHYFFVVVEIVVEAITVSLTLRVALISFNSESAMFFNVKVKIPLCPGVNDSGSEVTDSTERIASCV